VLPAAALDHPSWVEDRAAMLETGVRVLRLLTAAVTARPSRRLSTSSSPSPGRCRRRAPLMRAALVLSADHEFNASAFAARVVASTGANLYGATMAGLAALNGPRHGGLTRRVASCSTTEGAPRSRRRAGAARARPHLHPGLRPSALSRRRRRGRTLFAMLRESRPNHPSFAFAERLAGGGERLIDRKPNVDFTTVVVERVLGLPKDSALALFLLGRTVGWIAHALDSPPHAALIRPRARYTVPGQEDE
jgi:citrate synthase